MEAPDGKYEITVKLTYDGPSGVVKRIADELTEKAKEINDEYLITDDGDEVEVTIFPPLNATQAEVLYLSTDD